VTSADLRASAAALQAEPPPPSSSQQQLSVVEPTSPTDETDNGHDDTDNSRDDVATETAEDVATTTPTLRRHDSLKAKNRAMLAALAEKRLETVTQTVLNKRYNSCLMCVITIHSFICYLLSCVLSFRYYSDL